MKCEICHIGPALYNALGSIVPSRCAACVDEKAELKYDLFHAMDKQVAAIPSNLRKVLTSKVKWSRPNYLKSCTLFQDGRYLTWDEYKPLYLEWRRVRASCK